jgi:hypothetical protein
VLEDDEVMLLESPCSLCIGTVDAANMPLAARAWSVRVSPDRLHVRTILPGDAGTIDNLRTNGLLALTATNFATNVSVQIKGHVDVIEPETDEDVRRRLAFIADIKEALLELEGIAPELVARLVPPTFVACEMTVEDVFDQTPGPAAGARRATSGV